VRERRPLILNRSRDLIPGDSIYIGRPSKWGNPYVMRHELERALCLRNFRMHLERNPRLVAEARKELMGASAWTCWCAPLPCHGDIWMEVLYGD
jgi:hypothetical protein